MMAFLHICACIHACMHARMLACIHAYINSVKMGICTECLYVDVFSGLYLWHMYAMLNYLPEPRLCKGTVHTYM